MSIEDDKVKVETIKRRLKRKNAWHHNYLDELVDTETRSLCNWLANKGPRAQCQYLINNGWTVDEIVKEGKRQRRHIEDHFKSINGSKKRKH